MIANFIIVKNQWEDEIHAKMSLKLGNSYIREEMRKLSGVHGGKISVEQLAQLLKTFPEVFIFIYLLFIYLFILFISFFFGFFFGFFLVFLSFRFSSFCFSVHSFLLIDR